MRDIVQDECPDSDDIFDEHDEDNNNRLEEDELEDAMLDIILYILDGCQTQESEDDSSPSDCEEPSDAEAWGYALLSSVIISLIAFIGILIIPLDKATKHKRKVSRNFFHE